MTAAIPARLPPLGLTGLDPAWSRLVDVPDSAGPDGTSHTWHVLDNAVAEPLGTLLCVHGNPTWSYLWRGLLADPPPGWRVIAPDQLGMGWSERPSPTRSVGQRVTDLADLTTTLRVSGPVVTVGHDWGGSISLGWALAHRDQLAGVVLTNTAVALTEKDNGPALIRLAQVPLLRQWSCVRTETFVRGAGLLSRPTRRGTCAVPSRVPTGPRAGGRRSATSSRTSRSPRTIRPRRQSPGSPRASAPSACPLCSCGGRPTRSSASATWPTFATGCRRPSCTATKAHRTWSPRTRRGTPRRYTAGSPT